MRKLLSVMILVLVCAGAANAHEGVLSLFADQSAAGCSAELASCQSVPMYLMYVRGDGPEIANGMAFRLEKSSAGAAFLEPQWPGKFLTIGSLQGGIDVVVRADEGWCSGAETVSYMGTIPVVNFSESGQFTVSVVDAPYYGGVIVALCQPSFPLYSVTGGTFVFNGQCKCPEDPFGTIAGVETTSWGSIKSLYR
jgi:hypothetical protein